MTTLATPVRPTTSGGLLRGFSLTFLALDAKRVMRNRRSLIFTLVMPTLLYLVFGATQSHKNDMIGNANAAAFIMVHMAAYGSILATATSSASVAIEQQLGWTRTLRLTPLTPLGYITIKGCVALATAAPPLVILSVVGLLTGASAPALVWIGSMLLGWVGSLVFAAFGMAVGYALRSDAAMQVSGGVLALMAFAGNVFVPLKGVMLDISMFTPMFGVTSLANYPITRGETVSGDHIALWIIIANVAVWGAIFTLAAVALYRRSTERK